MTSTTGVQNFTPILTAAALVLLLAASGVAVEPGRFVPAGRPTPLAPDRGDLPPTAITQSFLDLVDAAEASDPGPDGDLGENDLPPARPEDRPRPDAIGAPSAATSRPASRRLEMCSRTSFMSVRVGSSGTMKPYPLPGSNHFTRPAMRTVATVSTPS